MESIDHLKSKMSSYHPISDQCWTEFKSIIKEIKVKKGLVLIDFGDIPTKFYFTHKGLIRAYSLGKDESSREVNKSFFEEGRFPSSVIAALEIAASDLCLEALEDSILIEIDHAKYRLLLDKYEDLKWYHIKYLEKHWIKDKEPIEIALLEGEARERYLDFIEKNPDLVKRIPLYHLASRLGITPTQLSRIRKSITSKY